MVLCRDVYPCVCWRLQRQLFQNSYTWLILALEATNTSLQVTMHSISQLSQSLALVHGLSHMLVASSSRNRVGCVEGGSRCRESVGTPVSWSCVHCQTGIESNKPMVLMASKGTCTRTLLSRLLTIRHGVLSLSG